VTQRQDDAESAHLYQTRNLKFDYVRRTRALVGDRQTLLIAEQEAMALRGEPARIPLGRLYTITANIISWAERYFESEHLRDVDDPLLPRGTRMEQIRAILFGEERDRWYVGQIASAVREAEDWYRPHLR